MKKWKKILGIVVLGAVFLTACSNNTSEPNLTVEPTHNHTFSTDWSKNETKHWHEADCGDDAKKDEAEHTFGDWQVAIPNDSNNVGTIKRICNICQYEEYQYNKMLITYATKTIPSKIIAQDIITLDDINNYSLISIEEERVQNYVSKGNTSNYWVDGNDNIITTPLKFNPTGITIYLKETANTYNVNVKYNAKSDSITTITYTTDEGYSAYDLTRTGYTFEGLSYNGNIYKYNIEAKDYVYNTLYLSDSIVKNKGLDVTAVWKYKYTKYNTIIGGDLRGEAVYGVKEDGTKVWILNEYLLVFDDEDGYDLKDKVFTCLDGYTKFVDDNGNEITIKSENNINIFANTMGEETFTLTTEQIKNYTYEDLLTYVLNHVSDLNNVGQLHIAINFTTKESPEVYNVNVKYNAKSDSITTITYTTDEGYSAYDLTRTGYTFEGLSYNGNIYKYNIEAKDYVYNTLYLSDSIVKNNGLDVTAVWKCDYNNYSPYSFTGRLKGQSTLVYGVKKSGAKEKILIDIDDLHFDDTESGYDLQDNVLEKIFGSYTSFEDASENKVTFASRAYVSSGVSPIFQFDVSYDNLTFAKFIEIINRLASDGENYNTNNDGVAIAIFFN